MQCSEALEDAPSDPRPAAIRVRRASKAFYILASGDTWRLLLARQPSEAFEALAEIAFEVPRGQFLGVLGRNGAGKSTLLRLLGGIYSPTRGQVYIDGQTAAIYELGLAANDRLTGREFATRWFSLYGTMGAALDDLLDEIAEFSELGEYFDRPIFSYSSGMSARLYFTVATTLPGQIYLIDEVLAVGDQYFQQKSWRRLRTRLAEGASAVVATHDTSAVLKLCEQALILESGHLAARGASPLVVRRYLDIPSPATGKARFIGLDDDCLPFTGRTGEDLLISLAAESATELPLKFGASIETFQRGIGWEHLLHIAPVPIGRGVGRHEIELMVPELPLNRGKYSLNLFLVGATDPRGTAIEVLDVRGWTHGNGLRLVVDGPEADCLCTLPAAWTIEAAS
jgi:lipopolysaccharide transport system ATP-binding protein